MGESCRMGGGRDVMRIGAAITDPGGEGAAGVSIASPLSRLQYSGQARARTGHTGAGGTTSRLLPRTPCSRSRMAARRARFLSARSCGVLSFGIGDGERETDLETRVARL